jgi:hypothetical protein
MPINCADRSFLEVLNHDSIADLYPTNAGAGREGTSPGTEIDPFQQHAWLEHFRKISLRRSR